jgi:hypothetical protein
MRADRRKASGPRVRRPRKAMPAARLADSESTTEERELDEAVATGEADEGK